MHSKEAIVFERHMHTAMFVRGVAALAVVIYLLAASASTVLAVVMATDNRGVIAALFLIEPVVTMPIAMQGIRLIAESTQEARHCRSELSRVTA